MKFPIMASAVTVCAILLLLTSRNPSTAYAAAQSPAPGIARCDAEAYVMDKDPNGLNVRATPEKTSKIIGNLPNNDVEGIRVHLTGASGEWVRIDHAHETGGEVDRSFFDGVGWVYGPLLGVSGTAQTNGKTNLYRDHSTNSQVVVRVPGDGGVVVRGCYGGWMYVEYKGVKGWGAPYTLCANPLTTCA
jgi:SH3-like domain-containing protein